MARIYKIIATTKSGATYSLFPDKIIDVQKKWRAQKFKDKELIGDEEEILNGIDHLENFIGEPLIFRSGKNSTPIVMIIIERI